MRSLARPISYALPLVVDAPGSRYARTRLLEGAMRSGMALAEAGMGLPATPRPSAVATAFRTAR